MKKDAIDSYQKQIIQIYHDYALRSIRGLNNENKINGRNVLTWHNEAIHPYQEGNDFDFFKNENDIKIVSDEILYFTASSYLYRPFINDPIAEKFQIKEGKFIYPNIQNLYAKKYDMFIDVALEKLYNFWDRIGDLIAACIPTGLNSKGIYYSTVINKTPDKFRDDQNFIWLSEFKENEYELLKEKRRTIVHYYSTGTEFMNEHLSSATDEEKLKKILKERKEIPDFLKSQINMTIEGYTKTLDFLIDVQE